MKKSKIAITSIAFVIAIVGVIATKANTTKLDSPAYYYDGDSYELLANCDVPDCTTSVTTQCTFNGFNVFNDNTGAQALYFNP